MTTKYNLGDEVIVISSNTEIDQNSMGYIASPVIGSGYVLVDFGDTCVELHIDDIRLADEDAQST